MKVYPSECVSALRGASISARGLWWELRMIMHESDRRGFLILDRLAMKDELLAKRCGLQLSEYQTLLTELLDLQAVRQTEAGIIFCPLMVKEQKLREIGQKTGKLGGNPYFHRDKETLNPPLPAPGNVSVTSNFLLLTSDSEGRKGSAEGKPPETPEWQQVSKHKSPNFIAAFEAWVQCRMGQKPKLSNPHSAFKKQAVWLNRFTEQDAIDSLCNSTMNEWRGLFEPRKNGKQSKAPDYSKDDFYAGTPFAKTNTESARF